MTASLLFCVGSLTVLGSIEDGLTDQYTQLATKALHPKDVKVGNFLPTLVLALGIYVVASVF